MIEIPTEKKWADDKQEEFKIVVLFSNKQEKMSVDLKK